MKKIVLIEDDVTLRENTLTFLKEEGFEAYAAEDGMLGIAKTKEVLPDLILCDIGLPKLNGYDTCIAIRKIETLDNIPLIFLTAYGSSENILKGFESGAQDYITKPFNYDELLARINTHIDLKHKKEELQQINQYLETKVKERTNELENANLQLAEANAELLNIDIIKTNFLKIIGSEIRKPLERIKEPMELLKHKIDNKNLAELIEIIDESVSKLENLSMQALDITQIIANHLVTNKVTVPVINIVEYALLSVQKYVIEKTISVTTDIPRLTKINGNSELLRKCFSNILENSCKHLHCMGTIEIILIPNIHYFTLEFKYNGPSMKEDTLYSIFKMLTPGAKQFDQNTGMGLYHSKLIAESHGGIIQITSEKKSGTSVIFTFPNA